MGCGVSNQVPCATVKTIPYEPLKRSIDNDDNEWRPTVNIICIVQLTVCKFTFLD